MLLSVNILMCTYNGEKYIREQLDSIIGQSYREFRIYIRDDRSTDSTYDIIKEYGDKYPGKVRVVDAPEHLGYPDCFWDILKRCDEADLYAFCDQDDVWDAYKLQSIVEKFGRDLDLAVPVIYIHDYENCDAELKCMSTHRLRNTDLLTDMSVLFYTYASGFSMAVNNEMRKRLISMPLIGNAMYHDELCIWIAHFHGKIVYDDRVLVKYRRHETTVTEYGNRTGRLISNWVRRELLGSEFGDKCRRIRYFLEMEDSEGDADISESVSATWLLLAGGKKSIGGYFNRLFFPHRLRPSIGGELALRVLFLLGKGIRAF